MLGTLWTIILIIIAIIVIVLLLQFLVGIFAIAPIGMEFVKIRHTYRHSVINSYWQLDSWRNSIMRPGTPIV